MNWIITLFAIALFVFTPLVAKSQNWTEITKKEYEERYIIPQNEYDNSLIPFSQEDKWGFKNSQGEIVIDPKFERAFGFSIDGLAVAKIDRKYGYINKNGDFVIKPKYKNAGNFLNGAAVIVTEKFGVIDLKGNYLLLPQFDLLYGFDGNFSIAETNGKQCYVAIGRETLEGYLKQNIEPAINAWQIKGEFEPTAKWKERVNENTRKVKIDQLAEQYRQEYYDLRIQKRTEQFKKTYFELMQYDADNESFLIKSEEVGDILLPVELDAAPAFKSNWDKIRSSVVPKFVVSGEDMVLSSVSFKHNGRTYTYDSHTQAKYAVTNIEYNFDPIDIPSTTPKTIATTGLAQQNAAIEQRNLTAGTKKSDIEQDIPQSNVADERTFVLIIANENYQRETEIKTAINDAEITKQYCLKTLGIPEQNIRYYENCTWKNMEAAFENFAYTMRVNPDGRFLVFYFGHGMADPDPQTEDSYLLPIDGSSMQIARDGFSRNRMLGELAKGRPSQCVVFLESCFSGATPTNEMLAYSQNSSGVRVEQKWSPIMGNLVVFSASSAAQTANAHPEYTHNIFTHELLRVLKESLGKITLGDLYQKVSLKTAQTADNLLNTKQNPTFQSSNELGEAWKNWRLLK